MYDGPLLEHNLRVEFGCWIGSSDPTYFRAQPCSLRSMTSNSAQLLKQAAVDVNFAAGGADVVAAAAGAADVVRIRVAAGRCAAA
jgi:hypothetical protein